MNQKLAISLFVGGLATFLMSLGEFLSNHETWTTVSSPNSVAHIMFMTATFCMTIAGALGTKVSRSSRSTDTISASTLEDIKKDCDNQTQEK